MTSEGSSVDYNGDTYQPGTLGGISEVEESQGAGGISLTFSGVDIATLSAAASPAFINSPVKVYLKVSAGIEGGVIMLLTVFAVAPRQFHTAIIQRLRYHVRVNLLP